MLKNDLHSHKQKAHLTSVVWPLRQSNGEYVDYVRMGYGKSKEHVIELAKILHVNVNIFLYKKWKIIMYNN